MKTKAAIAFILSKLEKELPAHLHYHSYAHTLSVLETAVLIGEGEGLDERQMNYLRTAAAYHDCGFLESDEEHEACSCDMLAEQLPKFDYSAPDIQIVHGLVMATKIPQAPKNHLEQVLCDADLAYFGGDDYVRISDGLLKELRAQGTELDEQKWLELQIDFLASHHYWTDYAKAHYAPGKQRVLAYLKALAKR